MVTKKQIGVTIDMGVLDRFKKKIYKSELEISSTVEFLMVYFCDKMDELDYEEKTQHNSNGSALVQTGDEGGGQD
jgi:ATP sulfurylase